MEIPNITSPVDHDLIVEVYLMAPIHELLNDERYRPGRKSAYRKSSMEIPNMTTAADHDLIV